jgi:hypothetical protein
MNILTLSGIALALLLQVTSAHAALTSCRPSPNCGSADKPCNTYITQGDTRTLSKNYQIGTSVIRVRLCTNGDSVCKDGANTQAISVFGYSGANAVYSKHLNSNGATDTGSYTKVPKLTRLAVRCNSVAPGQYCLVAWQHCKEAPSLKIGT